MSAAADLFAWAGRGVTEAAAVAAAVGVLALLGRRPLRRVPPSLQAWCWWLLAARLLLELTGAPAIELAWLPAASSPPAVEAIGLTAPDGSEALGVPVVTEISATTTEESGDRRSTPAPFAASLSPWTILGGFWLLGFGLAMLRAIISLLRLRGVVRRSSPAADAETLAELEAARRTVGVRRPVGVARSAEIATPLVCGLWRPTIVLPAAPRLAGDALRWVLLHELVHLRRGDGWRALVPVLARRLLYFHPVAIWAEREHRLAAEAACDAEVVVRSASPASDYGELLVRFALGPRAGARFAASLSLAGPSIHRRLEMLATAPIRSRQLALAAPLLLLALAAVALPIRLVADDGDPRSAPTEIGDSIVEPRESTTAAAPAAPVALPGSAGAPTPAAPAPGARWLVPPARAPRPAAPASPAAVSALPALAPLPPLPGRPAMPAPAQPPPLPPALPELRGADWLVLQDGDARLSIDAPRSAQREAERLVERDGAPVLLLGKEGRRWVVTDRATVLTVRRIFFEHAEEARHQNELARQEARAASEHAHRAMEASREALDVAARGATRDAERLARQARIEAQQLAEVSQELAHLQGGEFAAVRARAAAAAEQLERLQAELDRARTELADRYEREREMAMRTHERERARLRAQLEEIESRLERSLSVAEKRSKDAERELERLLREVFERRLAEPVQP